MPLTTPAWIPKPIIRRVYWSITISTQYVRSATDSHRIRSMLHKLSFTWPRNVNHEGPPLLGIGAAMEGENPPNDILIYRCAEREVDLLGNAWGSPRSDCVASSR